MTWVYLDDKWDTCEKIVVLSDLAKLVWVRGLTYCRRHGTGGFIPRVMIDSFLQKSNQKRIASVISELITSNNFLKKNACWQEVEGGFQIYAYGEHNDTKEEEERKKKTTAARVRRFRAKHKEAEVEEKRNALHCVTSSVTPALPVTPVTHSHARAIPIPFPIPSPSDPRSRNTSVPTEPHPAGAGVCFSETELEKPSAAEQTPEASKGNEDQSGAKAASDSADATGSEASEREPTPTKPLDTRPREVFDHYLARWHKHFVGGTRPPAFNEVRRRQTAARLKEGYSVEDLKFAIDGMFDCEFNCTTNNLTYELVVRSTGQVDKYLAKNPHALKRAEQTKEFVYVDPFRNEPKEG